MCSSGIYVKSYKDYKVVILLRGSSSVLTIGCHEKVFVVICILCKRMFSVYINHVIASVIITTKRKDTKNCNS